MRLLIFILSMLTCSMYAQTTKKGTIKVKKEQKATEAPMTIVDTQPEFPGGYAAMNIFLGNNLRYPQSAKEAGISGICYISFVVEKDGSISNVTVLRGVPGGPECDAEALRVINLMPRWSPGINKGAVVRVQYNLPVKFRLK